MAYAIGIDFGTLSARAILVDIGNGETIAEEIFIYPHGVMDKTLSTGEVLEPGWALQDPQDYLDALITCCQSVMVKSSVDPHEVVGLGMDITASTLLPVLRDKTPLCQTASWQHEPQAYIKLWKHHGGEAEAAAITALAEAQHAEWLPYYGGKVSSEWTLPKVLETIHRVPELYEEADYFLEVMDWLTWQMTDTLTASACSMGYKAFHFREHFPDRTFLETLDPRLPRFYDEKIPKTILPIGSCAGTLTEQMAKQMGLCPGTPVATPIIDAHCSILGGGICKPGEMMIIMGTSSCHLMLSDHEVRIPGIQGIVRDGILPGFYGIEAGQSCVGDHFAWFVNNCLPEAYAVEARNRGISAHQLLTEKFTGYKAGESGLIALDWFNGVRSPLMDFDLNGLLLGMNLNTRPEDIYLALVEATAFGTRAIIESFEASGAPVNRLILGGGIPSKNPVIVQLYADVLKRPVQVSASTQACALGAAMLGIAAAPSSVTGYTSLQDIIPRLARVKEGVYTPDPEQAARYDLLYADYMELHNYFGRGGNDIMRRLNQLRKH